MFGEDFFGEKRIYKIIIVCSKTISGDAGVFMKHACYNN